MKKLIITFLFLLFSFCLFAENEPTIINVSFTNDKSDLSPLEMYKPIYWIFGDAKDQTKLDFSFKYNLLKHYDTGLYLGYSQYAQWFLYKKSSPFGDINYNPEVFLKSKYIFPKYLDFIQFAPYEHMSNGRDGEDNRSLDRCYIQAQWSYGEKLNIGINAKGYLYYNQAPQNRDYVKHQRYYEATFFVSFGEAVDENAKDEFYVKVSGFKKGYQEVGLISRKLPFMNPRLYLQYYHGYCSSLLNYAESDNSIRIGVIFK